MKDFNRINKVTAIIVFLVALGVLAVLLSSCSEADKVNSNITKQAGYFECERKITVYNARTDTIIFECEGYMDISNNVSSDAVEVVRCKDCKYSCNPIPEEVGFVECLYCSDPRREPEEEMAIVGYDDFCSYGERKE